jgi:hypothetical protein
MTATLEENKAINEFQSQSRARGEATVKTVFLLSGGMLTLSIGAVLDKPVGVVPPPVLHLLQSGWLYLFGSIVLGVAFLCSLILGTYQQGRKMIALAERNSKARADWSRQLPVVRGDEPRLDEFVEIAAGPWVKKAVVIAGSLSVLSCLVGTLYMARAAIAFAKSLPGG